VPGWQDANGVYSDGCEACVSTPVGAACSSAVAVTAVDIGQSQTKSGNNPTAGQAGWITVSFPSNTNCSYHPKIDLTDNPNNEFVFDVYSDCSGTAVVCGTEGGNCTGKTTWESTYSACDNTHPNFQAITFGGGTTLYVKVYAKSTTLVCDAWTITFSN
jgi:hypothetical protein